MTFSAFQLRAFCILEASPFWVVLFLVPAQEEATQRSTVHGRRRWWWQFSGRRGDNLPSGKLPHNYGKSQFLMGKSTIYKWAIFNSYFDITRGYGRHTKSQWRPGVKLGWNLLDRWTDGEISAGTLRQRKLSREETFGLLARRWFKGSVNFPSPFLPVSQRWTYSPKLILSNNRSGFLDQCFFSSLVDSLHHDVSRTFEQWCHVVSQPFSQTLQQLLIPKALPRQKWRNGPSFWYASDLGELWLVMKPVEKDMSDILKKRKQSPDVSPCQKYRFWPRAIVPVLGIFPPKFPWWLGKSQGTIYGRLRNNFYIS